VEDAITKALDYLKQTQNEDGGWGKKHSIGETSLALIAYMSQGNFPGERPYGDVMTNGVMFLLRESESSASGYMGEVMYEHGLATMALSELWGHTDRDDEIREALKKAVAVILRSQDPKGGWRYRPEPSGADVSVTVMQIVALASAKQAGILVPSRTIDEAIKYVLACRDEKTGGFCYMPRGGGPGFARTGAALTSLMMMGKHDLDEVNGGLKYLRDLGEGVFREEEKWYIYGHYYSAVSMYLAGESQFDSWYPKIRDALLEKQKDSGEIFKSGYETPMAVIVLSIPYSYIPVYQR
jgi:hypothetical protein